MAADSVLVIGDINVDIALRVSALPGVGDDTPAHEALWGSGGGGLNAAVVFHELGAKINLVGCVGNDAAAPIALEQLLARGVSVEHVQSDEHQSTGSCVVLVTDDGERTFVSHRGANVAVRQDLVPPTITQGAPLLYLNAYALLEEPQRATAHCLVERVGAAGGRVAVDLCGPATSRGRETILALLPRVWTLVGNDAELAALFPDCGAEHAADAIVRQGVAFVARKRGAAGCIIVTPSKPVWVESDPVRAVDTTACGDAFGAAWAWGLMRWSDPHRAAVLANAVAARVASAFGAARSIPAGSQLRQLLSD